MEFVIGLLGAGIGSGIMAILLAALQRKWAKTDAEKAQGKVDPKKIDAMCEAIKTIMVKEIRYLGTCHVYAKKISMADKQTIEEMYTAYKQLPGANGHCRTIMEEVRKLEIKGGKDEVMI